jgi:hypothetical protein
MDSDSLDPNELPEFQMPAKILDKIFEFTGSTEENKGFMLAYVDQHGVPQIITLASSMIIEMGIRKAVEDYITEYAEAVKPDIDTGEQD